VGMYPMRIARYVMDSIHANGNGHAGNGHQHVAVNGRPAATDSSGHGVGAPPAHDSPLRPAPPPQWQNPNAPPARHE
jgi:hypothetical protein